MAGRRLRVALPLLAHKAKGRRLKRARRILNELTRAAGTGRDLDVLVGLYETRLGNLETPSAEQRQILRRLRRRAVTEPRQAGGRHPRPGHRPPAARPPPDPGPGDGRHGHHTSADPGGARSSRAPPSSDDSRPSASRYHPEALHALRRRVRLLRYTANVNDIVSGAESGTSDTWKALQDAIGALHDVHVLAGWLERQARRAAGRGERNLAAAAKAERARFETEGRRLHRKLLAARPGEMVARALGIDIPDENTGVKGGSAPSSSSSGTRSPFRSAPRTYPTSTAV